MSSHMVAITELDLSNCRPNSITDRINDVPGLKTSTAFFTFLRANLVQPSSAMSSHVNTPLLEPQTTSLSPPSPSPSPLGRQAASGAAAQTGSVNAAKTSTLSSSSNGSGRPPKAASASVAPQPLDHDDDIPPLSLDILIDRDDRVDALRLVADSVAQQRQRAALSLVLHPACLAVLALSLALVYQYAWVYRGRDPGLLLTLGSGVIMSYLLAIRYFTSPYITLAEGVGWRFLSRSSTGITLAAAADQGAPAPDGRDLATEDIVIGTRFGDELIGALVLRLEPLGRPGSSAGGGGGTNGGFGGGGGSSRRKNRTPSLKGGRGVIRAWTTKLRFRGKGVGGDMLREAVRVTRERCGRDSEVGFAMEHANSVMVLPEMFNSHFRKGERRAAKALETILAELEGPRRKR